MYTCKEWSPIATEVQKGDRIISVDDESVIVPTMMTSATCVSKILVRASDRTRKITLVRQERGEDVGRE